MKLTFKRIALLCLLVIIGFLIAKHYYWKAKITPKLNPHPKYFLTIQGYISPEFKGKANLWFKVVYSTTADECFYTNNSLAGSSESHTVATEYWIMTNKQNHYKIKVPLDKYQPGFCKWVPYVMGSNFVKENSKPILLAFADFYDNYSQVHNPKVINNYCKKNRVTDCDIEVNPNKIPVISLHKNQSYTVTVNYYYGLKKGEYHAHHERFR